MRLFLKYFIIFSIGGILYYLIEMLWRGYSHQSMFFLGGICFVLIGLINEFLSYNIPVIVQMILGTFIITALEFIFGCYLNIYLGLSVWNYEDMPFNILGQICLPYMVLWFFLTPACIILDDYIRYYFFEEEKPHYHIF